MADTYTLISPASPKTEHPQPVLQAPESETLTEVGQYCGLWLTCPPMEFPTTGKSQNVDSALSILADWAWIGGLLSCSHSLVCAWL